MGSHSSSPPPPPPPKVDQAELDRQASEKAAEQSQLAKKRRGIASTRLTDPVSNYTNAANSSRSRVSLLGGGETPSVR